MPRLSHVERFLWGLGVLCIAVCLLAALQALAYRHITMNAGPSERSLEQFAWVSESSVGSIEVAALGLSAPITADIDAGSLRLGVGHIRGTALPGGLGTVGLAGHRDSFFRPLRRIRPGMDIKLTGVSGAYHYIVDSTEIVTPDKVHVLDIMQRPALILITCFPFDYIGAAPRRFIVHAHLLSVAPDQLLPRE